MGVYTVAGDARRRLFQQRALEILEAAGESAAVLVHHVLAAGREALCLSAVSEAIVHFERAHQFVQGAALPEMPEEADLRDLYLQLGRSYELAGDSPTRKSKRFR